MSYQRSNDGLDPSSTTDAYERNNRRELDDEGGVRVNDGLSTSNTTDTQNSHGSRSREEEEALTGRSEYATSGSDAFDGRRDDYGMFQQSAHAESHLLTGRQSILLED